MRSNFAPRLGVRAESVFDVLERHGRSGRLVGIAHLLDPFGEDVVRSVTSVQPTSRIDALARAEGRRVVEEEDPDLLVLQLLAADQLGHVRGVRNPEYLEQIAEADRHVGDFLEFLDERGKLDDATVILMADHGQGRGIGGHGHLDWGERPVPFVVWGRGRAARAPSAASRTRSASWPRPSRHFSAWRPPRRRGAGRWCPCSTPASSRAPRPAARSPWWSPATRSRPWAAVLAGLPSSACGLPVDVLLVDDGSRRRHARHRPRARRHGDLARALARARRRASHRARVRARRAATRPPSTSTATASTTRPTSSACSTPVARGRADYVLGSRFLGRREGMTWHRNLANRVTSALVGFAHRHDRERRPVRLPRLLRPRARERPHRARLQLRPGAHLVALGGSASSPWRCRSPTGAGRAGARSCATRSTWRAWRPRSGASGATRGRRGGAPPPPIAPGERERPDRSRS